MRFLQSEALSIVSHFWRYKWLSLAAAWAICAAGWIGVSLIPTMYEASARVYINADGLLTPLLRGLAIDDNPARHVDYLRRTLLSRPNLEQAIHLANLDVGVTGPAARDALIRNLASHVEITPQTENLITIAYRSTNPTAVRNVVQSLLTIFAENTTGSNRAEMQNAQAFLDQQIADYEKQLRDAEARRAAFHEKYMDILPGPGGAASRLDSAREEVGRLSASLMEALSRRNEIQKELSLVPQFLDLTSTPQVVVNGQPTTPEQRLSEARAHLADLLQTDTDRHPDVIALRQEIAELEAQVKEDKSGRGGGTPKSQVVNSVYEQLKVSLVGVGSQVAALQKQLGEAQDRLQKLEPEARSVPGVEAKALDLDRDYGILKKNYEELLSRRLSAQMTEAADTKADKIQFRIIDPPQVPTFPVAPNRPLLLSGVLVVAILAALGVPVLLMQLDQSFATLSRLRELGLPVLGSVSRSALAHIRRRERAQLAGICGAALVLLMVYGALLANSLHLLHAGIT